MVIDTSVLIAILLAEKDAEVLTQAIARDARRLVSAFSAFEAAAVIHGRKGSAGVRELDLLLHAFGVTVVSLDSDQALLARAAYESYGKGNHPAGLNLGDCCSYALSRSSGEPLLFKGDDFSETDLDLVQIAE
ncbi:MAG TPA: type II toxin-antitoxin system VapC family toxin [Thermoanaerobaculia bacterium]